ncbi:tRNA preQ1(34) S-adenosylmethionine ribosyltransferase-isomerase QueA [Spirochaeta lutea]|uniref:S-adenosylmethionine:tRNA ribosyltransferase-isomerase n=1 Tax=Spirochaeta lutea TaxID=1480694 RepID=A0A098R1K6_9SPIO|nr:tRNA preQ1(34) S-adenosylmethionine ribosyltransferase-isomerase QueA [Spirochaeta lutea]KGE73671.1 S-adenosylmethionine tRNA ribosyltransferase [Spirochaeta lutea]
MKTNNFSFNLPEHLIAQYPSDKRGTSRLLVANITPGSAPRMTHTRVEEISQHLPSGSLLIFNDSRVRKARIFGTNQKTGSRVEFLLVEETNDPTTWKAMANKSKKQREGTVYRFPQGVQGTIIGNDANLKLLQFSQPISDTYLDKNGHIPLPPYIDRTDEPLDETRYQTVYARADHTGSVAAPTAGLHFTPEILEALTAEGHTIAYVTLHVGLGTFLPVRTEDIEQHRMHTEHYSIPEKTAQLVNKAKEEGRPIIAVGTTSIRTLESAWDPRTQQLKSGMSKTGIFIYPGYSFQVINGIFTNFHTPESTLLMLVSAFAGLDAIKQIYATAVQLEYRFFSYGDAMLLL